MANAVETVVSKQALKDLEDLKKSLTDIHNQIIKVNEANSKFSAGSSPRNPAQMQKTIEQFTKLQAQNEKATAAIIKNAERQRLAELKLAQDREKAFAKYEQQLNKEQQKLETASQLYNKVQSKLTQLQNEYKNLAIQKQLANKLTDEEQKRYDFLAGKITKYDKALKAVDASMGKHQRNVGNYASAFNPLSNSINQLTREAPAFANSIQTGFMAISNNLPIFFDAMKQTSAEIKSMRAEGQKVPGLFKQLTSSLFSWGTALSIGVTLLTVYGKELVEAFSGVSKLQEVIDKHKKSVSEAGSEYVDNAEKLKYLQGIVNDTTESEEHRLNALEQLKEEIPQISKANLDNADSLREVNKWTDIYIENAIHQAKANAFIQLSTEKLKEAYENQNKPLKESVKWYEDVWNRIKSLNNTSVTAARNAATATQNRLEENKVLEDQSEELKELARTELEQIKVFDKATKERKKQLQELTLANEDYLTSQYSLNKLQLELERDSAEKLYDDESKSFSERLNAFNRFTEKRQEIAELDYNEQIRLENKRVEDLKKSALDEYNDAIKQEGATAKFKADALNKYNSYIQSVTLQSKYNLEEIELKHSNTMLQTTEDFYKKRQDIIDREIQQSAIKQINDQELADLREYNNRLLNITRRTTKKTLEAIEKVKTDALKKAQIERLQLELRAIEDEIKQYSEGTEAWNKLHDKRISKEKELTNIMITENEKRKADQEKYNADVESYMNSFVSQFGSNSGFSKIIDIMSDKIAGFGEDATVTALAISEAFQEAFNTINEYSQINYENELARLESQKEIALQFAGESATAKAEIERQYDEKKREMDRKKAENEKKTAIFNAVIDTAQGVAAALGTANIPLAVLIGALGAAQIALIAQQPIPAYAEGTLNHSGGAMLINDGKGSNYTETVVTPDGKAKQYKGRNVMVNAPKGTKVFTHDQWNEQLNNILSNSGISSLNMANMAGIENNALTAEQMEGIMKKYSNGTSYDISIDETGFRKMINKNGMQREILNSRLRTKGRNV